MKKARILWLYVLVLITHLSQAFNISSICAPYNVDVTLSGVANVVGATNAYGNRWSNSPSAGTVNVFGTTEYRTNRTASHEHLMAMWVRYIDALPCDYTIDSLSSTLSFGPGKNCWYYTDGVPSYAITFEGEGQPDPKFIISFKKRDDETSQLPIPVVINQFIFANGATKNSTIYWHSAYHLPQFSATNNNPFDMYGTIIAAQIQFAGFFGNLFWYGQVHVSSVVTFNLPATRIMGYTSKLPACTPETQFHYPTSDSTVEDMRITLQSQTVENVDDPPSTILVNGDAASRDFLSLTDWQVSGQRFINDNTYNTTFTNRLDLSLNVSKQPCTRAIFFGAGQYTQNITIYPSEVVCFTEYIQFSGTLIFDAQGNSSSRFIFRALVMEFFPTRILIQKVNGAIDRHIYIQAITEADLTTSWYPDPVPNSRLAGHLLFPTYVALDSNWTINGRMFIGENMDTFISYMNVQPFEDAEPTETTGPTTEEILAAQTACATELRQCNLTTRFEFPSFTFSSLAELNAATITYEVQVPQETIQTTNFNFTWLFPNGSTPDTQPVGTWVLVGPTNGSCSDNITDTYPIYVYRARFTSTVAEMYTWFTGASHSLSSTTTDLIFGDTTSLVAQGVLQFGSREVTNCTVNIQVYFSPVVTLNAGMPRESIITLSVTTGVMGGILFILGLLMVLFIK